MSLLLLFGCTDVTVSMAVGTATATGLTPGTTAAATLAMAVGTATATGLTPGTTADVTVSMAVGTATATGLTPGTTAAVTLAMALGTATGAGLGPTITLWQPHAQPCYVLMIDKGTVGCPIISVSTMTAVMINDGRTRAVKV